MRILTRYSYSIDIYPKEYRMNHRESDDNGMIATCAVCRYAFLVKKMMRMMKMKTIPEVSKPYDGPKEIIQNEAQARFIENKVREIVIEEMTKYNQQTTSSWDSFHKQSQYLDALIKISSTGHKVHDEIDEALEKLKELTYQ